MSLPSPLSSLLALLPCPRFSSPVLSPLFSPPFGFQASPTHLGRGLCMSDSRGPASGASPGPHPPFLLVLSAPPCSLPAWPPGVCCSFLPLLSCHPRSVSPVCETGFEQTRFREEPNLDFSLSFCSGSVPRLPLGRQGCCRQRHQCVSLCPEVAKNWVGGASLRDVLWSF